MRTPRSACSASKAAAPASEEAVSTTKDVRVEPAPELPQVVLDPADLGREVVRDEQVALHHRSSPAAHVARRCRTGRRAGVQRPAVLKRSVGYEPGALEHAHGTCLVGVDDHRVVGLAPEQEADDAVVAGIGVAQRAALAVDGEPALGRRSRCPWKSAWRARPSGRAGTTELADGVGFTGLRQGAVPLCAGSASLRGVTATRRGGRFTWRRSPVTEGGAQGLVDAPGHALGARRRPRRPTRNGGPATPVVAGRPPCS